MNSSSRYSPENRALSIDVTVHDTDMRTILDKNVIIAEVRHLIAKEIVNRVMTKLEPVINQILGEYESKIPPEKSR